MALEYLKAKRIHDNFTDNYGKANFTVPRINETQMTSIMQKKEASGMTRDLFFGNTF